MLDTTFPQPAKLINSASDLAVTPNNTAPENLPMPMALFSSMVQYLVHSQAEAQPEPSLQEVMAGLDSPQTDQKDTTQDSGSLQLGALMLQMNWTQPATVMEPQAQQTLPEQMGQTAMPKAVNNLDSSEVEAAPGKWVGQQENWMPAQAEVRAVSATSIQQAEKPARDLPLSAALAVSQAQQDDQDLKETRAPDHNQLPDSLDLHAKEKTLPAWALQSPEKKIHATGANDKESGRGLDLSALERIKTDSLVMQTPMTPQQWLGEARETLKVRVDTLVPGSKESIQAQVILEIPEKSLLNDSGEISSLNIRIYPPDLGEVNARLKMDKGGAHLTMMVENQQVKEIIQASLPQLREHFQRMDISVSQLDVQIMENTAQNQQKQAERDPSATREFLNPQPGGSELQPEKTKLIKADSLVDTYA